MKKLRLLAISIFLGLNAHAGWHTNAPFIAWPATNHLRWATNVGTYTNESHWQGTNGYGGWTNNYVLTNLFVGDTGVGKIAFPLPILAYNWATNMSLNAKDVRILDGILSVAERLIVQYPTTYNPSNVFFVLAYDYWDSVNRTPDDNYFENFFRNERLTLAGLKSLTADMIDDGGWVIKTNATQWRTLTKSMVCSNAAVPPNYLDYTPWRALDMTSNAYKRILTNSWTIATTNIGAVTVTNVDSFSGAHVFTGTNGQMFSAIVTNSLHASGWAITDYGWDGFRRLITNLSTTVADNSWGIGYGYETNAALKSNAPVILNGSIMPVVGVADGEDVRAVIETVNSWPIGDYGYREPWGTVTHEFYWLTNNASLFARTNQAPTSTWSAQYGFNMDYRIRYDQGEIEGGGWETNWYASVLTNYINALTYTSKWSTYNSPLVAAKLTTNLAAELSFYYTTNGRPELAWSTNIAAGSGGYVTSSLVYSPTPDAARSFATNYTWFGVPIFHSIPFVSPASHDITWGAFATHTASTNKTFPTVSAYKTLFKWKFDYQ